MKKSIIRNYLIYCLCFGISMGIIFRIVTPLFVTFKSNKHDIFFSAMCILAGICVGYLSYSIGKLTLFKTIKKVSSYLSDLSEGNFQHDFHIESNDEIGELTASLSNMVEKLRHVIRNIYKGVEELELASEEISIHAQQLSHGTDKQAESSGIALQLMDHLSEFIHQNADNAVRTAEKSVVSKDSLEQLIISADNSISSFNEIIKKVSIINEIAVQTNILSLNAAVEAARAGEHGLGFAVIADEVRKLSDRSKVAAKEISEISARSFQATTQSEVLMHKLISEFDNTSKLVLEIKESSFIQSQNITTIIKSLDELNHVVQQNAASSDEIAASAEELSEQAASLDELVVYFKLN